MPRPSKKRSIPSGRKLNKKTGFHKVRKPVFFICPAPPARGWEVSFSTLTISQHRIASLSVFPLSRGASVQPRRLWTAGSAFLIVQLHRLAPRVISRTSTEIRISFEFRLMLVGAFRGACAFLIVQLHRLAPRVISRTSTEIRISFEFRLMLVGAFRGACAFLIVQLHRLAPRVISRTSTEIRISFEFRLMLVGADQGDSAFLF